MMGTTQHISLTVLQRTIRKSLEERFPFPLWVSAEISDMKLNRSGHCYLELIDKGESSTTAEAQARAVIWASQYSRIVSYFTAESGVKLDRGMKILCKVMVSFHELYGLSLQITDIDPSYTLGEIERKRQKCIAQLKAEGVWEMNHELRLSRLVQRIAVISSSNAAGYQDFHRQIASSGYYFSLTLFDSMMQGEAAESSIVNSLYAIAEREAEFDAVVIIRGGGSVSDLSCFDGYLVASNVAQFPLPIISGIGHDKDISVVDMVAHHSLKTPTAVATWLVERMQTIEAWLEGAATTLLHAASRATRGYELSLERQKGEVRSAVMLLLQRRGDSLKQVGTQLLQSSSEMLQREQRRQLHFEQLARSQSPERMLKLGFAIVRGGAGAVSSAATLAVGSELHIELAEGSVDAAITRINKNQ